MKILEQSSEKTRDRLKKERKGRSFGGGGPRKTTVLRGKLKAAGGGVVENGIDQRCIPVRGTVKKHGKVVRRVKRTQGPGAYQ